MYQVDTKPIAPSSDVWDMPFMKKLNNYRNYLFADYSKKQSRNPAYSLRAYAKYLGIPAPVLTETLKGKRNLPFKYANPIAEKLELSPMKRDLFLSSLLATKISIKSCFANKLKDSFDYKSNEISIMDEIHFNVISEWEHYAVLSLMNIDKFDLTVSNISKCLSIKENRAKVVFNNLVIANLITKIDGMWKRAHSSITTKSNFTSTAHKIAQKQNLDIAKEKIDSVPVSQRYHGSTTMAIDSDKIDDAKKIIRKFQEDLSTLLEESNKKEVYQLNIQLYPLSNINIEEEKCLN